MTSVDLDYTQPDLLTKDQLLEILQKRYVSRTDMFFMGRDELLEMYYKIAFPLPQREYRENRWGSKISKRRKEREELAAKTAAAEQTKRRPITAPTSGRKLSDSKESTPVRSASESVKMLKLSSEPSHRLISPPEHRLKPPPSPVNKTIRLGGSHRTDDFLSRIHIKDKSPRNARMSSEEKSSSCDVIRITSGTVMVSPTAKRIKLKRTFESGPVEAEEECSKKKKTTHSNGAKRPPEIHIIDVEEECSKREKKPRITWP